MSGSDVARAPCAAALLLALLLAVPAPHAAAQQAELRGRVVDSAAATPIAEAIVRLPDLGRYTLTSATGHFRVAGVPPGVHTVVVIQLGYADRTLRLDSRSDSVHTIALRQQPIALEALVVRGGFVERQMNGAAQARASAMGSARSPPVFWRSWDRDRIAAAGIDEPLAFLRRGPPKIVIRRCAGLGMDPDRLCITAPFGGAPPAGWGGDGTLLTFGSGSTSAGLVFVDDRLLARVEDLARYSMDDFHRVESYGYRGESGIRFYTAGYLRLVEAGLVRPRDRVPPPELFDFRVRGDSVPDGRRR